MNDGLRYVELEPGFGCYVPHGDTTGPDEIRFIHREIFHDHCYLRHGITLRDNDFVVDVGANAGLFTLYVKHRCPSARVLAVEPMPETFRALVANLELHRIDGVRVLRRAVGARAEAAVPFTFYRQLPGNSTRYPELKERTRTLLADTATTAEEAARRERMLADRVEITVGVQPLSELLAETGAPERIDLLKVDVEGAEPDVLAGIDEDDWPRFRQLVLELQDVHGELAAVRKLLTDKGFTVTIERPGGMLDLLGTHTVTARCG